MNRREFKDTEELIAILEDRGVVFADDEEKALARENIQNLGYYNLIGGYSFPFQINTDKYIKGTSIREIIALYDFDKALRDILLKYILPLETKVKSVIAYVFPKAHNEVNYLLYDNFNTSRKNANKNITELIAHIQRQIADRSSDPNITYHLNTYGYIPVWVLTNILSFGTISKFYSLMLQKERQEIARIFDIREEILENCLTYLSSVRNLCAHGNRLFCYMQMANRNGRFGGAERLRCAAERSGFLIEFI